MTASSRPSISRSQSSQQSSVESEDADDADAESENEHDAQREGNDQTGLDGDAMDVDLALPALRDRLADDVESEGDGDIPDDDIDDGGGDDDSEVLPGGGKGRLTARQAVLASMVGADHVELGKSPLTTQLYYHHSRLFFHQRHPHRRAKNSSRLKKLHSDVKRPPASGRT